MWLEDTLNNIFKINDSNGKDTKVIVRELTYIGEIQSVEGVYVVQVQELINGCIKNYCISAKGEEREEIWYALMHLDNITVYSYLKNRLLMEPFIENNFEDVLKICKMKLPRINVKEYSIFML